MANRKVLIVVGVLGVLSTLGFGCVMAMMFGGMALFGFAAQESMYEAEVQTTKVRLHQVKNSIDIYTLSNQKPPEKLDDMLKGDKAVISSPDTLQDAWGQPFVYAREGDKGFKLLSKGPDSLEGTDDDILLP